MIVGTGIDIAEVPRIREAIERHGQRFLHRIFTEGEIQYCEVESQSDRALCGALRGQGSRDESDRHRLEPRRALA